MSSKTRLLSALTSFTCIQWAAMSAPQAKDKTGVTQNFQPCQWARRVRTAPCFVLIDGSPFQVASPTDMLQLEHPRPCACVTRSKRLTARGRLGYRPQLGMLVRERTPDGIADRSDALKVTNKVPLRLAEAYPLLVWVPGRGSLSVQYQSGPP